MIDVMIITFNESLNLPHCLAALQGWTNLIFVIDSGSTDGTPDIARAHGAEAVHHDWEGYARQKNWGLRQLPFESEWILIVDADEIITESLRKHLLEISSKPVDEVKENGFFINRLTYFLDQPIRHCGYFPSWNLRFFKKGTGFYEDREVHEHVVIEDPVGYVKEPMIHDDRRGLEHYVAKHNRYSTLEARALVAETLDNRTTDGPSANVSRETKWRRWAKRYVLPRAPMPWLWRFLYMYIIRMGILDGRAGLEFCKFISVYDYLVALKFKALQWETKRHPDRESMIVKAKPESGLAAGEGTDPVVPRRAPDSAAAAPTSTAEISATQMQPEESPWTFKEKVGRAIWMLCGKPIFRLTFHNWYGFRASILRLFGARIGKGVAIRPSANIEVPWMIELQDGATVGDHAILYSLGPITVGKRAIISQYAHLCAGTHDYTDHSFKLIRSPITLGDDVWIGADAFIGPGVNVGSLSVIGARSSTYKDVEERTVYVGNPAKPIKERILR